jgi:hypothetical protein
MIMMAIFRACVGLFTVLIISKNCLGQSNGTYHRRLSACDSNAASNSGYSDYFADIEKIYGQNSMIQKGYESTCLPLHKKCGWPLQMGSTSSMGGAPSYNELPLFVLSVGLEGAGHHLWTELMKPVFDCTWINARHYRRDVGDGLARVTSSDLASGIREQFAMRAKNGKRPCKSIFDAEDSFPTGAIRKTGRVYMRPDIVNLEQLDGVLFRVKYLIIARNTTDTALSSLRRNFFTHVDLGLRCVEQTLTYLESALRGVPCNRVFVAHYEHVLAKPNAYAEPLSDFLEFGPKQRQDFKRILATKDKGRLSLPSRTEHKLTQYLECKAAGLGNDLAGCYRKIVKKVETFLADRAYMWPSFAGNGFAIGS